MIGLASPVKLKQFPVLFSQLLHPGSGCELLRLFRGGHCLRKTSAFRISSGQRPDKRGLAIMSQFTRVFGQTDRLGPVAKPVIGTGGQCPRQIVQRPNKVGI